jgi:DNA-binding beta-propeller fold protein YncE
MKHTEQMLLLALTCALIAMPLPTALAQSTANPDSQDLPNMGQQITPLAPLGSRFEPMNPDLATNPSWLAGQAVTTVVSPDHKTLLVLCSGFNVVFNGTTAPPTTSQFVFIYDISANQPVKKQVVPIPNTYNGVVFDPSGTHFYVAGGADDNIHTITLGSNGKWAEEQAASPALTMGHAAGNGLEVQQGGTGPVNAQVSVKPCAAGLAISNDGKTLVVANYYNDSITIFTGGYGNWSKGTELDLRPGKSDATQAGVPGGEYPFWVVVKGSAASATAYISSIRDREIDVVSLAGTPTVTARISVKGQPNKMTLNAVQSLVYVVEDESDTVDVIATATNAILETIPVIAPPGVLPTALAQYTGANSDSATLSPDEKQLYVTNGNLNSIAVVALSGTNGGDQVVGLIPTGWYPNSVSFSADGSWVYAVNGKSPTGANPGFCYSGGAPLYPSCLLANQYNPQLIKAGFQTFPRPTSAQLTALTAQVAVNNRFSSTESASDAAVMAAVRAGVQHVVFILKENRTYDQILGDLEVGNGDPDLTEFGQPITPNQHNLALNFVTLDNFMVTAEVSNDGWPWSTSARAPDVVERQFPVAYAAVLGVARGLSVDSEGLNRSVNVAYPTLAERQYADPFTPNDPDLLPGQTDVAAPDGPDNEINTGYLWDAALRANLTVRNYGFFIDGTRYNTTTNTIPLVENPAADGIVVAYPANAALAPRTDLYFRGFDNAFPDYYRYAEWAREFDNNYFVPACRAPEPRKLASAPAASPCTPYRETAPRSTGMPSLSLVRFMHDHTGSFGAAIDGVNTPDLQVADNDYAVGLLVQKIANSQYANNTLIFVVEDDAQDGGDHVDSHRSVAFVAGAFVKQGALVSTPYNTLDFVRTMEEVLGLPPMNLNDALAKPMADIFNTTPSAWSFTATPSALLYAPGVSLPLPPQPTSLVVPKPSHDAAYWARATAGMDFTSEDRVDPAGFNRLLWKGLMGDKAYPAIPSGKDLRHNRATLLVRYRQALKDERRRN